MNQEEQPVMQEGPAMHQEASLMTDDLNKRMRLDVSGEKEEQEAVVLDVTEQQVTEPSTDPNMARRHEVRHEVALPPDQAETYVPLAQWQPSREPARTYPFPLDPFQELATRCIDRGESVLVSAHTSAGKTVCAEYAIATALRDRQRVVYTSPIKALSNQKYRELQEIFGDVGLMTGDVTLNETASCLVMTTEILRSMLYRGSEVLREIAWVVFDEIHYMRDKERGVVWEETLILLPSTVRHVFLSATIPNALQFARWITHIHRQPCHVVYTAYRPTPLQHYVFPAGGDGIHLVVDEKGTFRDENFQRALRVFGHSGAGDKKVLGTGKEPSGPRRKAPLAVSGSGSDLNRLLRMVLAKNLQPAIVFSFSKRECESNALHLGKLDFNAPAERQLVRSVFSNALESLSEEDRALPQIASLLPLLERGIGIHHSGLLPLLKEVVEILFQEGLLKVLFATETFAIGLNMPARTVVFTSVRKFDGRDFRPVSSGEYIQMSGRAGRRGIDDRGIVVMMLDDRLEPSVCRDMIKGAPDRLNSAFHLSYNMILNLMRVDGLPAEHILTRSFFQFQAADSVPGLQAEVETLNQQLSQASGTNTNPSEANVQAEEYWEIKEQLGETGSALRRVIHHPAHSLSFLQPGRLVRVRVEERDANGLSVNDFGWCIVVSVQRHRQRPGTARNEAAPEAFDGSHDAAAAYTVEVVGRCAAPRNKLERPEPRPVSPGATAVPLLFSVSLQCLDGLSAVRLHLPRDLKATDQQAQLLRALDEVQRRFADGLPRLDPIVDQGIADPALKQLVDRLEALERRLQQHPLHQSPMLPALLEHEAARRALLSAREHLHGRIASAQAVVQMDELAKRRRVLRRLGYTAPNDDAVIDVKGRVACEISTGDELLLTELIFSAAFQELSIDQINALLSCFVFQERSSTSSDDSGGGKGTGPGAGSNTGNTLRLKEELAGPLRIIQEAARRIWRVSQESGLSDLTEAEYLANLRPELMDVVFAWSKGAKFAKICRMTEVFEGSIIRCLRRLEELLRQLAQAARSIGNAELEEKFIQGMARIKRDIVFANSLYL
jgi:ATP-dependent RNA helicase DOB1